MTRKEYFKLRTKLYKVSGELGTVSEGSDLKMLDFAYRRAGDMLDAIDILGEQLGYIDPDTNSPTDGRRKRKVSTVSHWDGTEVKPGDRV